MSDKVVTHERRFDGVEAEMRAFLDAIEPLGERAVLWTQLPGSFAPISLMMTSAVPPPPPPPPPPHA